MKVLLQLLRRAPPELAVMDEDTQRRFPDLVVKCLIKQTKNLHRSVPVKPCAVHVSAQAPIGHECMSIGTGHMVLASSEMRPNGLLRNLGQLHCSLSRMGSGTVALHSCLGHAVSSTEDAAMSTCTVQGAVACASMSDCARHAGWCAGHAGAGGDHVHPPLLG